MLRHFFIGLLSSHVNFPSVFEHSNQSGVTVNYIYVHQCFSILKKKITESFLTSKKTT